MTAKLSMVCSEQSNGTFFAICPEIKGCFTQGDTYEQAFANLKDLVKVTIHEELDESEKEQISQTKSKIFAEFEVVI